MAKKIDKKKSLFTDEEIEEDLKEMEILLQKIRAEYNQFFIGASKNPPYFTEIAFRKLVKKYAGDVLRRPTHRFKFYNLLARYNTNKELWARKLKMLEGQDVSHRPKFIRFGEGYVGSSKLLKKDEKKEMLKDISFKLLTRNPPKEPTKISAFYDKYIEIHNQLNKKLELDRQHFYDLIARKTAEIRNKTECRAVEYELKLENGKIKLKAKPIK